MPESRLSGHLKKFAGMPASEFVLHREPMLLLDRLIDAGTEYTICEWQIRDKAQFLAPGLGVPAYIGVEHMAQCVAVHAGARARVRGLAPPLGFLLGTRHYKATVQYFELDVVYRARVRELLRDDQGMGSYDCNILRDDEIIAEARLAVLEKEAGGKLGE